MTTTARRITAEGLLALPGMGRCELIQGEIIHMSPAGAEHGSVAYELSRLIGNHVVGNRLGVVFAAKTGFIIERDPDTTRAPDVAFVSQSRLPKPLRQGFFEGPPDLAVEVVSPSDVQSEVRAKVEQWLSAGAVSVLGCRPAKPVD